MRTTKGTLRRLAIVLVVAIVIGFVIVAVFWWGFEPGHLRVRLLCKTDHQRLLEACQQLSNQVITGKLGVTDYWYHPRIDPAVSQFPHVIRALHPNSILIDGRGRVTIEMFGGLTHFGVNAYPDGFKPPYPDFRYGDRELIPNLWYYDDEYHRYPEFDEVITRILDKCGRGTPGGRAGTRGGEALPSE